MGIQVKVNGRNIVDFTEEELQQIFGHGWSEAATLQDDLQDDQEWIWNDLFQLVHKIGDYVLRTKQYRIFNPAYDRLKYYENFGNANLGVNHKTKIKETLSLIGITIEE